MSRTTLICLNSEQVVANVIAMGEVKPNRLVVISTEDMSDQFSNLCACAAQLGLEGPDKPILVPPWDFEGIGRAIERQMPGFQSDERIILNATGGTKPMALVALEYLKGRQNFEAIYIDSKNICKYVFSPAPPRKNPLSYFPSIQLYLRAYGLESRHVTPEGWLEEASGFLARHFEGVLGLIWKIVKSRSTGGLPTRIGGVRRLHPRSTWHRFLSLLRRRGIIRGFSQQGGEVLEILWGNPKEGYSYFLQSGWLEHLIYHSIKGIADEVCLNLCVHDTKQTQSGRLAEYDVVARKGATLFFFECKSGTNILNGSQLTQALQSFQAKVKLSGGVMAQPIFVLSSRFRRPSEIQNARARHAGVKLISYDEIRDNLEESLEAVLLPF